MKNKMSKHFYGKVTKSGNKLLINIPYDDRISFKHKAKVKVFLLDIEEIIEENIVRGINYESQDLQIYDAKKIIERYDPQWSLKGKNSQTLIDYAKKLLEENNRD